MRIKLKKTNAKRLASLSALGVAALGGAAGTAAASSIVFSGPVDATFPIPSKNVEIRGPGDAKGVLTFGSVRTAFTTLRHIGLRSDPGRKGTRFAARIGSGAFVSAFPLDAMWGLGGAVGGGLVVYTRTSTSGHRRTSTPFNATNQYLLFEFTGGGLRHDDYGWAQLEVSFSGGLPGCGSIYGCLDVTLVDYAYDSSGAQIPAGDTGVPEPPTAELTGLTALVLGAKGLRAWRAARKVALIS